MRVVIPEYSGKHRVLSIAVDQKTKDDLINEGVGFLYITDDKIYLYPEEEIITENMAIIERFEECNNYDVFELYEDGNAYRCYDDSSSENVFFITEKCNSNCTMCPMPELARRRGNTSNIENLINIASHIPTDVPHMTITGGEPFMVGKELFELLKFCRDKFEKTEFQLLTNGRAFAIKEYCEMLKETMPNYFIVGIPLHGSEAKFHDLITQTPGSFDQTLTGLKHLQSIGVKIEIRMVVCRDNAIDLKKMAELVAKELSTVSFVSIMAMEMTGSAYFNEDRVWIPYKESFKYVRRAVEVLINSGIDVRLYNFPLCVVDNDMRMICFKSISSWKVRYREICDRCTVRKSCGGVFAGTMRLEQDELEPII